MWDDAHTSCQQSNSKELAKPKTSTRLLMISVLSVLSVTLMPGCSHGAPPSETAYIRLNQVGYEGGPIRAYLLTRSPQTGITFTVKKSTGEAVVAGAVGSSGASWAKYKVYPLDFTVPATGEYTLSVSGPHPASTTFRVDTPAQLYTRPLNNALRFFQDQRDGPEYIPSGLRTAPAHLNDQRGNVYKPPEFGSSERIKGALVPTGAVVDASGGWWDAGDSLKFVHTTSYTEAMMLVGVRDFPRQMGSGSSVSNFAQEAKFGLDWLLRMWDNDSATLYYQVGIGSGNSSFEDDHSIWRLPQQDDTYGGTNGKYRYIRNRPVLIAGPAGSKVSPNLAGRLAADFALCFTVYRTSNPEYANRCLVAAEHIFDLADTSPPSQLLTASPHDFYGESEWRDDMELAATELYLATRNPKLPERLPHRDPAFYLKQAADLAAAYIHAGKVGREILSVADVSPLAHFELYRALTLAGNPSGLAVTPEDLLADMHTLDGVFQNSRRPFPSVHGYQFHTRPDTRAISRRARHHVHKGSLLIQDEAKGITSLGDFGFFDDGCQKSIGLVGINQFPSAPGDSAQRRVFAGCFGALLQQSCPIVGRDGVELLHQIIERIGHDFRRTALSPVKVAAKIVERAAAIGLLADDGVNF